MSPLALPSAPRPRIITLASFLPAISGRLIADALAERLRRETNDSVLLVEFETAGPGVSLRDFSSVHPTLNGEFCFPDRLRRGEGGFQRLELRVAREGCEPGLVKPLLDHLRRHFRFVLLRVGAAVSDQALFECSTQSDSTYLFIRQSQQSLQDFNRLLHDPGSRFSGEWSRLKAVLCLSGNESARVSPELVKKLGGTLHAYVRDCPPDSDDAVRPTGWTSLFDADLRRLAREIGRKRIGLALSSGGAKGLAHIGVIQVLEENGIEVDVIAGCSMGAYIGAVWGHGCDGGLMEKLAREVEGRWGLWNLVDPVFPPRTGFIRGVSIKGRLQRTIGAAHFSELARPIRVVATNLYSLGRAVFANGEVASAVHASFAIPGVCTPVVIEGEAYVDGGIADPLPVDVLEEMGINRIIAVNTIPTPAYLRCCLEMEREQESLHGRRHKILKRLNRRFNYFAPGNVLDVMMRAVHGAQIRVAEDASRRADVVLRPLSMDGHWYEFDKPAKFIAMGRRVAQEQLGEIRALIGRRETLYEDRPAQNAMAAVA